MKNENHSFFHLLLARENGFSRRIHQQMLQAGQLLEETRIIKNFELKDLNTVQPDIRSSYVISCNSVGHAAISHTNRTISIINTKSMKKIKEIPNLDRTVWTISYHPLIPSLLATGSVGGLVMVYENYEQKSAIQETSSDDHEFSNIIPSVSFHSNPDVVVYSIREEVKVWNWRENRIIHVIVGNCTIRFMKYNPLTNMLITVQSYHHHSPQNCADKFFETIGALSLVLNSAYDPCCVGDAVNFLTENFFDFKCYSMCTSKIFLMQRNFDRLMNDFYKTVLIWHRKLESFPVESLEIKDSLLCENMFELMKSSLQNCCKISSNYKRRLIEIFEYGDFPIKVALQLCLNSSLKLSHKYFDAFGPELHEPTIAAEETESYFVSPKILQVCDFENLLDLRDSWLCAIAHCESHNDVSIDISNCGRKVAVCYNNVGPNLTDYSRLRVFSLERHNLGELLHNIRPNISFPRGFIGASFSPSTNYLLMVTRINDAGQQSCITAYRLDKQSITEPPESYIVERNIGFVKWSPNCSDGIVLGFSTFILSCWRY